MATTPEGRVKRKIRTVLDKFGDSLYYYMPVPSGYGIQSIDFLVCYDGLFIGIEAKANARLRPTPRQDATMEQIRKAGGATFVVHDDESLRVLEVFLDSVKKWG